MTQAESLATQLESQARAMGFTLYGVCAPEPTAHMPFYQAWLAEGCSGEMGYLGRADSIARRADLRLTMETVRSVVVVGHEYASDDVRTTEGSPPHDRAIIARYARGADYHDVLKGKLVELASWLDGRVEGGVRARPYVDTGPILERDLARRAGLGWFGRNTMLISPTRGSYFVLGLLLVDVELPRSQAFDVDRCGSCHACLDACPTGALLGRDAVGAPVMDARRCISYLTIELRGPIPAELRPAIGNRVFGCDICQEVCPWTRFSGHTPEPAYHPRAELDSPRLVDLATLLLDLDDDGFRARFRGSPVSRARRTGLLRNVCVGLGNLRTADAGAHAEGGAGGDADPEATLRVEAVLRRALGDESALVRGHAAWALGRIRSESSAQALRDRRQVETEDTVCGEIDRALEALG